MEENGEKGKTKWFQTGWENYCAAQEGERGNEGKEAIVNRRGAHFDEIKFVHFCQTWRDLEEKENHTPAEAPFMSLRTH